MSYIQGKLWLKVKVSLDINQPVTLLLLNLFDYQQIDFLYLKLQINLTSNLSLVRSLVN